MASTTPSLRSRRLHPPASAPWVDGPPASHRALVHPRFRQLPPPVIVIGGHRSGTSVVTALLAALGLYMGEPLLGYRRGSGAGALETLEPFVGNAEATEFRLLNDRLLGRAGATWNRIDRFLAQREQPGFSGS